MQAPPSDLICPSDLHVAHSRVLLHKQAQGGSEAVQAALNVLQLLDQLNGLLATQTGHLLRSEHHHAAAQVLEAPSSPAGIVRAGSYIHTP